MSDAQHEQAEVRDRADGGAGYEFGQVHPDAADGRLGNPGSAGGEPLVYLGAVGGVDKRGLPGPVPWVEGEGATPNTATGFLRPLT